MRAASGDGILEAKELEKWCKKNYSKYLDFLRFCLHEDMEIPSVVSSIDWGTYPVTRTVSLGIDVKF